MFVGQLGYYTHHSYYDKLNPFSTESDKYVLLQLGVRYYQPGMGRFTQRDPKKVGHNWYIYAANMPLTASDPTGMLPWNPGFWDKPGVCDRNNCYTYACNDPRPPGTAWDELQPGAMSGCRYDNYPGGRPSCTNLLANAIRDYGLRPQGPDGGCGAGWHKVCLYVDLDGDKGYDYHWYRDDGKGYWSDKPGAGRIEGPCIGPGRDPAYETKCPDTSGRPWCMCAKDKPWQ